jgi:hypothetical protein
VAKRQVEKENYFEGSFVRKRSLINWHAPSSNSNFFSFLQIVLLSSPISPDPSGHSFRVPTEQSAHDDTATSNSGQILTQ